MKVKPKFKIRCLSVLVIMLFLSFLIPVLVSDSPSVSSPSQKAHTLIFDAPTWTGSGADNLASTVGNWDNNWAPDTGECVVIDTGSKAITWDIAKTFSGFYINSTYTGVITVAASFGCSSFTLASAATFTSATTYTITNSGSFTKTAGTVTDNKIKMTFTGTGNLAVNADCLFNTITVNNGAHITVTNYIPFIISTITVQTGGQITINSGKMLTYDYAATSFTNSGTIDGAGTLRIFSFNSNRTISPGDVDCLFEVRLYSSASQPCTVTLGATSTIGALKVFSEHATRQMTFATSSYALTVTGDSEISTRATLTQGAGIFSTGSLILDGAGSIINQGGAMNIGTVSMTYGTIVGDSTNLMTVSGNFTRDGGTTHNTTFTNLRIRMTGIQKHFTYVDDYSSTPYDFEVAGYIYLDGRTGINVMRNMTVEYGATMNISSIYGINFSWTTYSAPNPVWSNEGTITGTGKLRINTENENISWWDNGSVECDLVFRQISTAWSNSTITLMGGNGSISQADYVEIIGTAPNYRLNVDCVGFVGQLLNEHLKVGENANLTGSRMGVHITHGSVWLNTTVNRPFYGGMGGIMMQWTADPSDHSAEVQYTITGLSPNVGYKVYKNGTLIYEQSQGGVMIFTSSGPGVYEIKAWYQSSVIQLGVVLGLMMALVILTPIIVMVAQMANERKKPTSQDMINTALFIVIGVTLLGVVYALLP